MVSEFARSSALPHVEARRSCQQVSCYRPHAHDAFSVGLVEEGASVLSGPVGGPVRLQPGDVVVIAAGQVHRCDPDGGDWRYRMVHVGREWADELASDTAAARLLSGVVVVRDPRARQRCLEWSDLVFSAHEAADLELSFRALLAALAAAEPVHAADHRADQELLSQVAPVLQRLRDDEANPGLDELAALVGLSRFQLVRAVKRATGLSPLAWRQNARIVQARGLLRGGTAIAETAHATGFTDQSHFHRVFRAHVAATPRTYQG